MHRPDIPSLAQVGPQLLSSYNPTMRAIPTIACGCLSEPRVVVWENTLHPADFPEFFLGPRIDEDPSLGLAMLPEPQWA